MIKDLTETAAQCGDDPKLLMRKFNNYLFTGPDGQQSILRHIQPIANYQCHGIIEFLRDISPKLSEDDLTFCSLLCLGFAPNSIQMIYGQSNPASFYNRRSRLRRRLGVTDGDRALETLLSEMIAELAERESRENGINTGTGEFIKNLF